MKKILFALTIAGLLAAVLAAVVSGLAERRHREVEIAVDLEDVQVLARDSGATVYETLTRLRDLGATAVGLREGAVSCYLQDGRLSVARGGELQSSFRLTGQVNPRLQLLLERGAIRLEAVYLLTEDNELASRLLEAARLKLGRPVRFIFDSSPYVLEVSDDLDRVLSLRAGLDQREVAMVRELGLRVVARPDNPFVKSEESVRKTMEAFLSLPQDLLSAVVFEGKEVTGFPDKLEVTAASLNEKGIAFGVVEIVGQQSGVTTLAARTGGRAVLVHANAPTATAQSMINAVRERRVRLLYFRMPLHDPELPLSGPALLAEVTSELAQYGHYGGPARPLPHPLQHTALLLLSFLGVAAAAGLLGVEILRKEEPWLWLVPAAALLAQLSAWVVLPDYLARQLSAIAAAIVLPTLVVVSQQLNRLPDNSLAGRSAVGWSLLTMLRTFLLIAAGGLAIFGLTATPYFSAGAVAFRGVKLVHTVPLLLVAMVAIMRFYGPREWVWPELVAFWRRMLSQPVLVAYLFLLVSLAVLAYIYVARTGHAAGMPVAELELRLRALLGDLLLVRPRLKEFLFGYPLAVLGLSVLAMGRRDAYTATLLTLAAVAPVSMTNTFMHFTASLPIILLRSFNGLWLGVLLGLLLTAAALLAAKWAGKKGRFA
ncbi:MAG: hypothetical protein KGZ57_12190 [Dethiobacter sp.]|nr:hypothetical protein [Dethiobacter sp.]MCL5982862.1 DUF5693 family protein [Bacillota bacterium]